MRGAFQYRYELLNKERGCISAQVRHAAVIAAIYTINISILVVLLYSWRININVKRAIDLQDVYLGVQIAYFAIIGTQLLIVFLSIILLLGILREDTALISPWIVGFIALMAMEAVAMVYSNVLRDHVNKKFDTLCKIEVIFYISRSVLNILAIIGVMKFYNLIRSGVSFKIPEAIEL
ncbi:uncharacterized protein [Rhodnius prolixus]|uniref:uncharacterized protein n=1 Tax=Rhodnius prolixus TaxID=13249 RepID=UPI003D18CE41